MNTDQTRVEVAARAILESRLLGTLDWDKLRPQQQAEYRADATLVLERLDAHADGCVWTPLTRPRRPVYPMVVCELCGATGWSVP